MIEAQYDDYHSDKIERTQDIYYPIYDYLCKMYLDKYAAADMSEDSLTSLIDELVERVIFDIPEEYNVETEEFYRFGQTYYSDMTF